MEDEIGARGSPGETVIRGRSRTREEATIRGRSRVREEATIRGRSRVREEATIRGRSRAREEAVIRGGSRAREEDTVRKKAPENWPRIVQKGTKGVAVKRTEEVVRKHICYIHVR